MEDQDKQAFLEEVGDRQWYSVESLPEYEYDPETGQGKALERVQVPPGEGNLISSRTGRTHMVPRPYGEPVQGKGMSYQPLRDQEVAIHRPVIDIDLPCRLVESSTPGHFHLYIDADVDEDDYFKMLDAMMDAGVVQEGFANLTRMRGASFVRPPWVKKGEDHGSSQD